MKIVEIGGSGDLAIDNQTSLLESPRCSQVLHQCGRGAGSSTNMVGAVSQFAGIYRERAPDPALREHVRYVWVNDLTGSQNEWIRVVPDGCVDIVWTGTSLIVAGPDTRSILDRLLRGAVVVGVRFHPGAALSWLGVPLSEIVNSRVPLAEF